MRSFTLADWTTIRGQGTSSGSPSQVTQDETLWLDLEEHSDVVIYLDVSEVTAPGGTVTFFFETAPSKDDPRDPTTNAPLFFQTLASVALSAATSSTVVLRALMSTATVPLARYLRWRAAGPTGMPNPTWDATFRALVSANGARHVRK